MAKCRKCKKLIPTQEQEAKTVYDENYDWAEGIEEDKICPSHEIDYDF